MLKNAFHVLAITTLMVAASGCQVHSESCGDTPSEPIEEFEVTITTGGQSCDCDVEFCFKRYSSTDWECGALDKPLWDDFEARETATYYVVARPAVDVGDLETFEIVNANCDFFFHSSLAISWVEIYGIDHWGHAAWLYEEEFTPHENFDEGEALAPNSCSF